MKDNKKGIILVIVSMTIFSVQDVMIKFLSVDISMFQILFYRSIIGVALICVYLKLTRQPIKFTSAYPILGTCRGLLFFFGYSAFYFAQSKVPIANATVLFLVSPFFITIMSIFVFGSRVGYNRWFTMVVGFAGVVVISQPGAGEFNLFYILPLLTAFTYAISMMIAKSTAEKDTVFQQVIFMYLITALLSGLIGLAIGDGSFNTADFGGYEFLTQPWRLDDIPTLLKVATIGVIGTIAFLMLTNAYRISDPATITPFEYTGLLATMLGGYLFWGDVPGVNEATGMLLIVGSGIFLFYRENLRGQQTAAESPLR